MMKNWTWFGLYNLLPQKTLMLAVVLLVEMLRLCVAVFMGFTVDALTRAHEIRWGMLGNFAWLFLFESALIAITYLREVIEARAFAIFERTVFSKYWGSVINIDIDAFMRIPIGTWMGKLSYDIKMVCSSVKHSFCVVFGYGLFWIGSAILMSWKCGPAVFFLLLSFTIGGLVSFFFLRRIKISSEKMRKSMYVFSEALYGVLKLHPLLVVYGATSRYLSLIRKASRRATEREKALSVITAQHKLTMGASSLVVRGILVLLCMCLVVHGKCTIGEMVTLIVLVGQLLQGSESIVQVIPVIQTGMEALSEIRNTISMRSKSVEFKMDKVVEVDKRVENSPLVKCNKISFAYPDGKTICKDFSLALRRGDFCAFIGKNGTGKSTVAKMILKILNPTQGNVSAAPISIGWVPQDMEIGRESVLDAIRLRDLSISEESVETVLRECNLEQWVKSLPNGIHSKISMESISGGQLQLLSVARALIRKPDLLVVDEVSNNLDIVMKRKIYDVLRRFRNGRIVVVVSHDIESINLANRIFLFNEEGVNELSSGISTREIIKLLTEDVDDDNK